MIHQLKEITIENFLSNSRVFILLCVSVWQVLGALLVIANVRGGHLGQSGGYGAPAAVSYGAPVGGASYSAPGGYSGGSTYTGAGYSSGGHAGYDEQVDILHLHLQIIIIFNRGSLIQELFLLTLDVGNHGNSGHFLPYTSE